MSLMITLFYFIQPPSVLLNMGLTPERIFLGVKFITVLESFPIFCGYLLMILLAGQWKKYSKPLVLRHVSIFSLFIYSFEHLSRDITTDHKYHKEVDYS